MTDGEDLEPIANMLISTHYLNVVITVCLYLENAPNTGCCGESPLPSCVDPVLFLIECEFQVWFHLIISMCGANSIY